MPISSSTDFTREEVRLALRNPGMPLEALRRPITPIGMHYVLIHFDVPDVDPAEFELVVDGRVRTPAALTRGSARAACGLDAGDDGVRGLGTGAPCPPSRVGAVARRGDRLR
jgi:hypothetical protein